MRFLQWMTAALLVLLAAGCGDDIQGSVRLLLVPPHQGRNPTQDPFQLVELVEIGVIDGNGAFSTFGQAHPTARFGPGLVDGDKQGAPYVLGLNDRGRPVSWGFASPVMLHKGIDETISLPFSQTGLAAASRITLQDRTSADPFAERPPSLFVDQRNLESGAIDGPSDLTALVTALWQGGDLLLRVGVRDNWISPAGAGDDINTGDALRIYYDGLVITAGADGRCEAPQEVSACTAEQISGGWRVEMTLPLGDPGKNRLVPFDLRLYDSDDGEALALATWRFDPRRQGEEPLPEDYGKIVLETPLLQALPESGPLSGFSGPDGMIEVGAGWNDTDLVVSVRVPDDDVRTQASGQDLQGADRVEMWLDLANAYPPISEPVRFLRVTGSAGASEVHAGGQDPADMRTDLFGFTGSVSGTAATGEYVVEFEIPWSDLQLESISAQKGWFLGIEIRVVDEDDGKVTTTAWSNEEDLDPNLWPELRLFDLK